MLEDLGYETVLGGGAERIDTGKLTQVWAYHFGAFAPNNSAGTTVWDRGYREVLALWYGEVPLGKEQTKLFEFDRDPTRGSGGPGPQAGNGNGAYCWEQRGACLQLFPKRCANCSSIPN